MLVSTYAPFIAALVTFLLTYFILNTKATSKMQDVPNGRSLHSTPVPRIGGVALIAGVLSGWLLMFNSLAWWLVLPLLGLFVVSLLDDVHNLPVKQRLLAHLIAAAIMVGGSGLISQQGVVISIAVLLFTVWMTNLYNFMDGSDGLAAGMALFGFGMYGIAALLAHNPPLALLSLCITAAAAGFLYFNFHPAKIFMGDAGSIPLGFLAAAIGLWGWQQGVWTTWFPLLVFSPFIIDASVTLLKRIVGGAKVTEAHREHYYQRLILMGWGHQNVALAEYVLMLLVGLSALWMLNHPFSWQMLLAWCLIYACLMLLLDARWKNYKRGLNV
ncbi:MAG: glycosyltransferase family 4 protein [Gallionellaceae bacterium]|jgi:UDP-N-acetylmuramyl pentapeptide phosphotransferase/UDP-N-acetylglucosamine-1-phosphate transferase